MTDNTVHSPENTWQIATFPAGADLDRFEAALSHVHSRWHVRPASKSEFSARLARAKFDDILLTQLDALPLSGERDMALIDAQDDEQISIVMVEEGVQRFRQGQQDVVLKPGVLAVWDNTLPITYEAKVPVRLLSLVMPKHRLTAFVPGKDLSQTQALSADSGSGFLLASHLRSLPVALRENDRINPVTLANATLQLAACTMFSGMPVPGTGRRRDRLCADVLVFIDKHLQNTELTPSFIAHAFGISVTYLHRLFQDQAFSISEQIRKRRLDACRRDLENPARFHETLTEICFRWGFNDSAHFSRCFRGEFGISPSAFRRSVKKN